LDLALRINNFKKLYSNRFLAFEHFTGNCWLFCI
jgi:hypothetical protein